MLLDSLYEPFANEKPEQWSRPREIVLYARKYLNTLIRLWYLRHGFKGSSFFLCRPLAFLVFHCLQDINDEMPTPELEATRSTLFLMAKGLREQGLSYYLAETLFRVVRARMRPEENQISRGIKDIADEEDDERKEQLRNVRSEWPVDILNESGNVGEEELGTLVEQYLHIHSSKSSISGSPTSA